jgi:hypothetical protein
MEGGGADAGHPGADVDNPASAVSEHAAACPDRVQPGVVDRDVDPAARPGLCCRGEGAHVVVGPGQVSRDEGRRRAGGADLLNQRAASVTVAAAEHHLHAIVGQSTSGGRADAAGRTRDERGPMAERRARRSLDHCCS